MKLIVFFLAILSFSGRSVRIVEQCDIQEVYQGIKPETGTLAKVGYRGYEEVTQLLIPTTLDVGKYKITLSRIDNNLYKIRDKNVYFKTISCFEYPSYDDIILKWESNYGYTKGVLIFTN